MSTNNQMRPGELREKLEKVVDEKTLILLITAAQALYNQRKFAKNVLDDFTASQGSLVGKSLSLEDAGLSEAMELVTSLGAGVL